MTSTSARPDLIASPTMATLGRRASLAPGRAHASDIDTVVRRLCADASDRFRVHAFTRAVHDVVSALAQHFPENIFCDVDYLAACMWRAESVSDMTAIARKIEAVCRGFGCTSALRFRYAHDFLYGFDWARWVAKAPRERASVGPFDLVFLGYLERRQGELEARIHGGDAVFGVIEPGTYRNPFCFVREPHEELELHGLLAELDLVPVKAWSPEGERRWDLPFTELRAQLADRLGLSKRDRARPAPRRSRPG